MVMSHLDASGGLLAGDFARLVADEQKAHPFTLKQQRVYAEKEKKRGKGASGSSGEGGPGKK